MERSADLAAQQLLGFSGDARPLAVSIWLNPARDRWLNADTLKPWQFWLYAVREFWLKKGEEAQALSADVQEFEKIAEEYDTYLVTLPQLDSVFGTQ